MAIDIGVRANIHLRGGGRPSFARMASVGGGGSSRNFPRPIRWGGSSRIFSVNCSKFVLFKHVLCFARIMSTLCPNVCPQTARIGGAAAPPVPACMHRRTGRGSGGSVHFSC